MRNRPTVILHEQNAVLGRANRFLARHADMLALSFAEERTCRSAATIVSGNGAPGDRRSRQLPYQPPTDTLCLLTGGSLGARVFSDVVPSACGIAR